MVLEGLLFFILEKKIKHILLGQNTGLGTNQLTPWCSGLIKVSKVLAHILLIPFASKRRAFLSLPLAYLYSCKELANCETHLTRSTAGNSSEKQFQWDSLWGPPMPERNPGCIWTSCARATRRNKSNFFWFYKGTAKESEAINSSTGISAHKTVPPVKASHKSLSPSWFHMFSKPTVIASERQEQLTGCGLALTRETLRPGFFPFKSLINQFNKMFRSGPRALKTHFNHNISYRVIH